LIGPALADDVEDRTTAAVLGGAFVAITLSSDTDSLMPWSVLALCGKPNRATVNQIAGEVWHGSVDGLIELGVLITTAPTVAVAR
jgi:trans-2-enoyl-CoA reductase